jgi:CO dehydrogenase nickel-insertion accessory protein CooC1
MKILIRGKDGSGNCTISALLAKEIAMRNNEVLVVDTDESNFGLYKQLGFEQPRDFMESLGGKETLLKKIMKFIRAEDGESLKMLDDFRIEDIPEELIVGENGIKLIAIGKIQEIGDKIDKRVLLILNRIDENSRELLELVDMKKMIGKLPFNKEVFKACLKGEAVPALPAMEQIADRLLAALTIKPSEKAF